MWTIHTKHKLENQVLLSFSTISKYQLKHPPKKLQFKNENIRAFDPYHIISQALMQNTYKILIELCMQIKCETVFLNDWILFNFLFCCPQNPNLKLCMIKYDVGYPVWKPTASIWQLISQIEMWESYNYLIEVRILRSWLFPQFWSILILVSGKRGEPGIY